MTCTRSARLVLILSVILFVPVSAQEPKVLPRILTDPTLLASRTWKSDTGLEKAVSDWPLYEGKQEFDDKTVVRRGQVQVAGVVLEADYRIRVKDSYAEVVLIGPADKNGGPADKFDAPMCIRFSEWTAPMLGVPSKVIDLSSPVEKDNAILDIDADWLLGETRVKLSCSGVKLDGKFLSGVVMVTYGHHTMQKALEDLIYIECSSTRKFVGRSAEGRGATEEAPVRFMINPNDGTVRRWDKSTIGKTQRYSDEDIVTTWGNEERSFQLRLDRRAGSYLLEIRRKNDPRTGLDTWGKCARTTPDKKF